MLANNRFGATLGVFGGCADRYCRSGYGLGGTTMAEMLDLAAKVEGLDGVELVGNWNVNNETIGDIPQLLSDHGLELCMVVPDVWAQSKWRRGSLAAPDAKTRQAALDEIKKTIDWAAELNCPYVDVWPGQDGFDYCFQMDYREAWKWLGDGLAACGEHNPKVKVLIEYKLKEPRTHCLLSHAAKSVLLIQDLDNVGILLDVGHALAASENMAEVAVLLDSYGKLDYLHLNDNYRSWDDDMMVGAVHLVEYLELVYWLKRINYSGWLTLDLFPYREDGVSAANQSRRWMEGLYSAVERVGMDAFQEVIKTADACQMSELVRQAMLGSK